MPSPEEWYQFLSENHVPESKIESILIALASKGSVNLIEVEVCGYFLYWWEADPNTFRVYVDANGFDHWRMAHPEFTSGCPA